MKLIMLVLDKSMNRWCPKTSKLRVLKNLSHEPRKIVPLGTISRNTAESKLGVVYHNDIVKNL